MGADKYTPPEATMAMAEVQPQSHNRESEQSPDEKFYLQQAEKVAYAFSALVRRFHGDALVVGHSGEDGFSGDAASLFTAVRMTFPDGHETIKPIKLGWGEFSAATFTKPLPEPEIGLHRHPADKEDAVWQKERIEVLRSLSSPLYILPQRTGYFGLSEAEAYASYQQDPTKYFSEHAVLAYDQGTLVRQNFFVTEPNSTTRKQIKEIPVPTFDSFLAEVRNRIVARDMGSEEFAVCLKLIPEDVDERRNLDRATRERVNKALEIISYLGIDNKYAVSWGGEHLTKALQEIKAVFNFETKKFE